MEPIEAVGNFIESIADKIWPSQDEKLKNADLIAQLKALPAAQDMSLRLQQASIASNLTASHNTFLSLGLALIYFTCGFCVFHDYFIASVLGDFGIKLNRLADLQIWQLTWLLVGGGAVHITHAYLNNPIYPSIMDQLKAFFKRA